MRNALTSSNCKVRHQVADVLTHGQDTAGRDDNDDVNEH